MVSERVALVTGGGTGIGTAAAKALAASGYTVIVSGRRPDPLDKAVAAIAEIGGRAIAAPADVTREEQVLALFQMIGQRFGRLDLLFNNAGIGTPGIPVEDLSLQQWQAVVDTNLTGAFLCTREAFRMMKNQNPRGGRIINNGSVSATAPRPHSAPYTATKHAITGLTKSTSLDGRPYDIACGQIDIGNAATAMAAPMQQGTLQANGTVAVEPTMDVAHVGDAIAYMANLPLGANVQFMTVMATAMPFIGRG
jgi:NAD(P)-dependent dehydrogenase (short-subunit alcohol dehydrogenase family)